MPSLRLSSSISTFSFRWIDVKTVSAIEAAFSAMVALSVAIDAERVAARKIGSASLDAAHRTFPRFKTPIRDRQGAIAYWWFRDGDTLSYDADPDAAGEDMPMREVMSVARFLGRIAEG